MKLTSFNSNHFRYSGRRLYQYNEDVILFKLFSNYKLACNYREAFLIGMDSLDVYVYVNPCC